MLLNSLSAISNLSDAETRSISAENITGEPGKGVFCLNGPAALKGKKGDVVTIMAFSLCTLEEAAVIQPKVIVLDENNQIIQRKGRVPNADL